MKGFVELTKCKQDLKDSWNFMRPPKEYEKCVGTIDFVSYYEAQDYDKSLVYGSG